MNTYIVLTILIIISATFAYINQRYLKLPFVIGLFVLSTVLSLIVLSSKYWVALPYNEIKHYVEIAHIDKIILNILLGFLLFAGSLHIEWKDIRQQIKPIITLALGGVIVSTLLIASMFYLISNALNLQIDFIYCLLFGALISPTDPIAVLGILTKANVNKKIESTIVGESLFNDGIGVVIFIALLEMLNSGSSDFSFSHFGLLFLQEAVGGIMIGFVLGYCLHVLLKSVDHYQTEVLLTLAFVMGGYALSSYLHLSGALAMVIMGLLVGNFRQDLAMSDTTLEYVNKFWELVDVILNAILFIIISFVLLVIEFRSTYLILGVISICIVLLSRIIVVYFPKMFFPKLLKFNSKESLIITWGSLRGGLSLALVLSLPLNETKNMLLIATYFCVLFSIIIQGLTIEKLAKTN